MTQPKYCEQSVTFDLNTLARIAVAEAMALPSMVSLKEFEALKVRAIYQDTKFTGMQITVSTVLRPTTPTLR